MTRIDLEFTIDALDFVHAGEAASRVKRTLEHVGMEREVVRRASIAAYEAEMNIVIHSVGGTMKVTILPDCVEIVATDRGPGIEDIDLAMQEGYSTAPPHIREMGFGAGMGLPNMKRCADDIRIESAPGRGTTVRVIIRPRHAA